MRSLSQTLLAGASMLATACASNPPPEPTPPPVVAEVPRVAPQPPTPLPANPTPAGPAAGSKGDFAAKSTDRVYFDYDQYNLDDPLNKAKHHCDTRYFRAHYSCFEREMREKRGRQVFHKIFKRRHFLAVE